VGRLRACLFENLFVTNSREAKHLGDDVFLRKLAAAYAQGLDKAFDLKPKKQSASAPKTPSDEYIRVQLNGKQLNTFREEKCGKMV
jgi:hypothetical protein